MEVHPAVISTRWPARSLLGFACGLVGLVVVAYLCARSFSAVPWWMAVLVTLPVSVLAGVVVWALVARGPSAFAGLRLFGPRRPPDDNG